jgi:hypothetical protein
LADDAPRAHGDRVLVVDQRRAVPSLVADAVASVRLRDFVFDIGVDGRARASRLAAVADGPGSLAFA